MTPSRRARDVTRTLPLLLAILLTSCAAPLKSLTEKRDLDTDTGMFLLTYAEADDHTVKRIEDSLQRAATKLQRWGHLEEPVKIHILPSHAMLEEAVDRQGYDWLRAWARYDEIFLQSPRTWSLLGATQHEIDELILHELTHCLMYQLAASRSTWPRKRIPLWFREGMASYTARQGYRWPTLEELSRFLRHRPEADPLNAPDSLYQGESDIVYGAAHHAFNFLVRRYGEERVQKILSNMDSGGQFPESFYAAIGVTDDAFADDFRRYVRLRGFRGGRLRISP